MKIGIFIGRFQPFHDGHRTVIEQMIKETDKQLVIVGSVGRPRTPLNPFTYEERATMIKSVFEKVDISFAYDYIYQDNAWAANIQAMIYNYVNLIGGDSSSTIVLYGHHKDETSFYLDMFPAFKYKEVASVLTINAASIRDHLFTQPFDQNSSAKNKELFSTFYIEPSVAAFLCSFVHTKEYAQLKSEYLYIKQYKEDSAFKSLPYAPIFVTVDALVECGANVLLVQRGGIHGHGLLAMPGGFLNANEKITTGIFRELKEETKINVPPAIIRNSLKHIEVFDDPRRSSRGRTITHCGLIKLEEKKLPEVVGSDDAKLALWMPISDVEKNKHLFFEDHYFIIQKMLKKLN